MKAENYLKSMRLKFQPGGEEEGESSGGSEEGENLGGEGG